MLRRFSPDFALFSMAVDAALVFIALSVATYVRPFLSRLPFVQYIPRPFQIPLVLYLLFPIIWVLALTLSTVYDGRRNLRVSDEISSLTFGCLLAVISLAGTLYLSYREVSRLLFLTFAGETYLLLLSWRLVYRLAFRYGVIQGVHTKSVLIIGAGLVGRELETQIRSYQNLGMKVVGFLDDDPTKRSNLAEILGSLDQARKVVTEEIIDDVVLALPLWAHERVNRLVADLHDLPVKVWVIPDYFSLALHRATISEFAGLPMLDLRAPALTENQRLLKRIFDIIIATISIIMSTPLMALIAIAIQIDSRGPITLRQKRVGENGRLFEMLKFRSMVANAEELNYLVERIDDHGNMVHKHSDDPRVTRVGRILRRLSLDELPQLFNVLKGEMSLVGPRPELPYLVEKYEPWQRKRFAVPQGLTGWWQINGRSDKPMHLNTEDDLYYVQNYSLWLDIQILFLTIWVVLRGKGAY
jgi:exopolysaccharide biosynthesis polyprenyl glycosylphosphotransferase